MTSALVLPAPVIPLDDIASGSHAQPALAATTSTSTAAHTASGTHHRPAQASTAPVSGTPGAINAATPLNNQPPRLHSSSSSGGPLGNFQGTPSQSSLEPSSDFGLLMNNLQALATILVRTKAAARQLEATRQQTTSSVEPLTATALPPKLPY